MVGKLHYKVGLFLSFFLLIMALSGFLLNHSSFFKLREVYISNKTILKLYNIPYEEGENFAQYSKIITLEKVILDIHSGVIFGKLGRLLSDIIAISTIILIISGLIRYAQRRKNNSSN